MGPCRGDFFRTIQVGVTEAANSENLSSAWKLIIAARFDWEGQGEHLVKYTEEAEYLEGTRLQRSSAQSTLSHADTT